MKKIIKLKSIILNKKTIFCILSLFLFLMVLSFTPKVLSINSPKAKYTVVIDAGHGGLDVK